jgi:hypothetical protein
LRFVKLVMRPTPRKVKGDEEASQAFIDELRRLYDAHYHTKSRSAWVVLTERSLNGCHGFYRTATRTITVTHKPLTEYAFRALLIHELAHHYQDWSFLQEGNTKTLWPGAAHGSIFRLHYWRLRAVARDAGLLHAPQENKLELEQAAAVVREARELMGKSFLTMGKILFEARKECRKAGENFEVFLEDRVGLDVGVANDSMRAQSLGLPPQLDFDTMRFLMGLRDTPFRAQAQSEALPGTPLFILRLRYRKPRSNRLRKL